MKYGTEFILCAAIHYKNGAKPNVEGITDGTVIAARRHGDCYTVLKGILGEDTDMDSLHLIEKIRDF